MKQVPKGSSKVIDIQCSVDSYKLRTNPFIFRGARFIMDKKNYSVADFSAIPAVPCPCGMSRRAFIDESERKISLHTVEIKTDARYHYHKKLTEIYYILEGEGFLELDGDMVPVKPGMSVLITPGCRHRAVGRLKVLNVVLPAFDPADEFAD